MTDDIARFVTENADALAKGERPPLPGNRRWITEPTIPAPKYGAVAGKNAARRRRALGLSVSTVAAATGIETWELERFEEGDGDALSIDQFLVLCICLGTSPAHLLMPQRADHAKAAITLPGGTTPRDSRWAGSLWLWFGGEASLTPRHSPENFPPAQIRAAIEKAGGVEVSPRWDYDPDMYDECNTNCWFSED
ncbi:helix-turn-helix domain-containing protein [Tsukamurella pseudospumae]|nr:helix-turn-helix domain-containing protein [Tsukamurella pseudospumae]